MRTRYVAVAIVALGLFIMNEFTRTIPVYVAAGLWGGTLGFLVGCWQMSKVLRPADPPPPLTGPPLAKAGWLTGSIGGRRVQQYIWVTVHADRLVVWMPMVGRRTVMADQLGPISTHGARKPEIQIEHQAPGLASPVTLRLRADHPVRRSLVELVRR